MVKNVLLYTFLFYVATLISCSPDDPVIKIPKAPESVSLAESIVYEVNLKDRSGDSFKVRAFVEGLTGPNDIFQFPAVVPGTYSIHNFGDYIVDFRAYDENYYLIQTEKISANQWQIKSPEDTHIIEYEIAETWDRANPENHIYKMAGTTLEIDHVLMNTFAVFGYPTGLKEKIYYLKIEYPGDWSVGTALPQKNDGLYVADDYDHLADSPFLIGKLTNASSTIDATEIDVWVYSFTGQNTANQILNNVDQVLLDAQVFLKELPVDHYSFLFHFGEFNAGALEHSYSSIYVLPDYQPNATSVARIKDIAAHEFFHIVTPLNIHSEIIDDFNFVTPTPSAHLWLYEGVTEWASDLMQYRNNSITLESILSRFSAKVYEDGNYDPSFSLTDISLQSYTAIGGAQFGNIYNRGAIVAALLDIRLLELSGGEFGLRELILELMETYGKDNAFVDDNFFDIVVNMTYPEIGSFIDAYISGNEPLPLMEYFSMIGIDYDASTKVFTRMESPTAEQQYLFEQWSKNL